MDSRDVSFPGLGIARETTYDDVLLMMDADDGSHNFPGREEDLWEKVADMTVEEALQFKAKGGLQ